MREMILNNKVRIDGRLCDQIRPISIDMHLLPRTHGSALFTRGETQALCVCTLGGENAAQRYETLNEDSSHQILSPVLISSFLCRRSRSNGRSR
jgi:polyribonucleotide nucleotidyltransferase